MSYKDVQLLREHVARVTEVAACLKHLASNEAECEQVDKLSSSKIFCMLAMKVSLCMQKLDAHCQEFCMLYTCVGMQHSCEDALVMSSMLTYVSMQWLWDFQTELSVANVISSTLLQCCLFSPFVILDT